ncbi:MAG: GNAT family N-acetyltransferase [Myxococcaceae bacterium]|nr:GNAT family N-acetyltransferase [Myxococcaceae bacterium]
MTAIPRERPVPQSLARRIEYAQAEQVDRTPSSSRQGVPALHVAGGRAVFFGPRSPYSTAVGLGLVGPVRAEDVDRVEAHLGQGGGAVRIELTPFCDPSLPLELARRGYRVEQHQLVWWRPPFPVPPVTHGIETRLLRAGEERRWAELFFHAFVGRPMTSEAELGPGLAIARTEGNTCFVALERGEPRAVGAVSVCGGVALLSADGVPPPYRGRGFQLALIHARLAWAAARGCDGVTASTEPATPSQRSYEKAGFRCAYPKLVMVRESVASL